MDLRFFFFSFSCRFCVAHLLTTTHFLYSFFFFSSFRRTTHMLSRFGVTTILIRPSSHVVGFCSLRMDNDNVGHT